jgi:hypothetical protein
MAQIERAKASGLHLSPNEGETDFKIQNFEKSKGGTKTLIDP